MTSILLNKNNDIEFTDDDSIAFVDGVDELIQCLKQNVMSIDFVTYIKQGSSEVISSLIKSAILNTNGVLSINSYVEQLSDVDCGNFRNFIISFSATTIFGQIQVVL